MWTRYDATQNMLWVCDMSLFQLPTSSSEATQAALARGFLPVADLERGE
jgi:hypothetical protein